MSRTLRTGRRSNTGAHSISNARSNGVDSSDRKHTLRSLIAHLRGKVPYKETPREKVKLPARQKPGRYREPAYPYKIVPAKY